MFTIRKIEGKEYKENKSRFLKIQKPNFIQIKKLKL